MKILLLYAPPAPGSFASAVRDCAIRALRDAGHEVDLCDLCAEGFDAVQSTEERALYKQVPENSARAIRPLLGHIRVFGAVTTYGSPWWFMLLYLGNPSRKVLMRGLSRLLPAGAKRFWLPLYGMESASAGKRERFLQKVRIRLASLK